MKIMILKRITFLLTVDIQRFTETQVKVIKHLKNYKFNLLHSGALSFYME